MNLATFQHKFLALIHQNNASTEYLSHGYLPPDEVVSIYTNHYFLSLTDVLTATYSCVQRLVGEDFFKYLSHEYINQYPPISGNIVEYGNTFAEFIANFEPCKEMPYLSEIANFEYCYEQVYHYPEQSFLLYSSYALIDIWQLDEQSESIDINTETYLKIANINTEVEVFEISPLLYLQEINHAKNLTTS